MFSGTPIILNPFLGSFKALFSHPRQVFWPFKTQNRNLFDWLFFRLKALRGNPLRSSLRIRLTKSSSLRLLEIYAYLSGPRILLNFNIARCFLLISPSFKSASNAPESSSGHSDITPINFRLCIFQRIRLFMGRYVPECLLYIAVFHCVPSTTFFAILLGTCKGKPYKEPVCGG